MARCMATRIGKNSLPSCGCKLHSCREYVSISGASLASTPAFPFNIEHVTSLAEPDLSRVADWPNIRQISGLVSYEVHEPCPLLAPARNHGHFDSEEDRSANASSIVPDATAAKAAGKHSSTVVSISGNKQHLPHPAMQLSLEEMVKALTARSTSE